MSARFKPQTAYCQFLIITYWLIMSNIQAYLSPFKGLAECDSVIVVQVGHHCIYQYIEQEFELARAAGRDRKH
jgi:hypothetical protein